MQSERAVKALEGLSLTTLSARPNAGFHSSVQSQCQKEKKMWAILLF